jgi:hypothetical protein
VDGFVRPTYLEIFLKTYLRLRLDQVVLMPSLETAVHRARTRGDSDPTVLLTSDQLAAPDLIAEQVKRRYALFADTPYVLATDGLTTEQTAAAIRALVESGRTWVNPA